MTLGITASILFVLTPVFPSCTGSCALACHAHVCVQDLGMTAANKLSCALFAVATVYAVVIEMPIRVVQVRIE
jgi:Flp pilus assembly protein protease CpaA